MKLLAPFFLSFIFWFIPVSISAQDHLLPIEKKNYSLNYQQEGFILDNVYDNSGLLWIGGLNGAGLMRFDGKQFTSIAVPYFGTDDFSVIDMQKDKDGLIYILFYNKGPVLLMLDPLTLRFTPVQFAGRADTVQEISRTFKKNGRLYSVVQDSHQISLYALHQATATKIIDFKIPQSVTINQFSMFIPYRNAYLLIAEGLGCALFNKKGELVHTISRKNRRRFSLVTYKDKHLFRMDGQPYLYTYLPEKRQLKRFIDLSNKTKSTAYVVWNDARGRLLLSTADPSGVSVFNVTPEGLTKYLDIDNLNLINWPRFFSKDATQSIWIANQLEPLIFYRLSAPDIKVFLKNKRIGALYQKDSNEVLISTSRSGWFLLNTEKNTIQPFKLWKNNRPYSGMGRCRNIIPGKRKRYVWTNFSNGIARLDLETHEVNIWRNYNVEALARFNDSLLVYGTYKNGLWVFNTRTKKQRNLFSGKMLWIRDLFIQNKIIYAATSGGVLAYHWADKKITDFPLPDSEKRRRKNNGRFNCFLYKPGKGLLAGTEAGIVYRFNLQTGTYRRIFENPNRAGIQTLFFDKGKLWINTRRGIFSRDTLNGRMQRFSTLDGLSYKEASRFSVLKTTHGVLVGTRQGLNYFDPSSLHPLRYSAQLIPLSLVRFNEETDKPDTINNRQALTHIHQIVLPVKHRFFRLHFAMSNRTNNAPLHFRYKLGDHDWTPIEQGNFVQFENLAPGKYQLKVAAFDAYGYQIGDPLQYEIKTKDFFYKRWWFAATVVLVILTFTGIIIFSAKQRKEVKLKKEALDSLSRSKQDKEEKLRMERLLLEETKRSLEIRKRELVAGSLQMANLKNAIKKIMKDYKDGVDPQVLKRRLTRQLNQEDEWELFMKKFTGVYPEFSENLQKAYPDLSQKNLDFCALVKLNLTNKEIATLLNISHQSVITKKYRLRKKMDLNGADNSLEDLIARI